MSRTKISFKNYKSLFLILSIVLQLILPETKATANTKAILKEQIYENARITLFAKSGSGDYFTLYPDGIKKEDAFIGGFKSAQLDPLEENIYFYDTLLRVIGRINLQDGKVYKVIGKPKSTAAQDFSTPVKFGDAILGKINDFIFDRYGNIFILDSVDSTGNSSPRILKASLKDQTIKEVLKINDYFLQGNTNIGTFTLNSLSYDHDRYIYLCGLLSGKGAVVLKFDPLSLTAEVYAGGNEISTIGFTPKLVLDNSNNFSPLGVIFDHNRNCFLSGQDYINSVWNYFTYKITSSNGDTTPVKQSFIGDGSGSLNDIGDGGEAKSAYAGLLGSRCLCGDIAGDIYIADSINNKIRKVLSNGLITTIIGGGNENLSYGQSKTLKSISLQAPNSLLVDKINNLYIAENNRILFVTNLITTTSKTTQNIKLANLSITKIAGNEVKDPKGQTTNPDLTLEYTYAGEQPVEVKAENIPDGTNINLFTINNEGASAISGSNKLSSGLATIPIKIEAGTTKVIKAESDPFIPALGVYLPGSEPKIELGQLPPEPELKTPNRNEVNIQGNLLSSTQRFNFSKSYWKRYENSYTDLSKTQAAFDPDNAVSDATQVDFGTNPNTIYLDHGPTKNKQIKFSVWMRTDSENLSVPIGIGPSSPFRAPEWDWSPFTYEGQWYFGAIANNQPGTASPYFSWTIANVTPQWQKFSFTNNSNINAALYKTIFIGGLGNTNNKKVYFWGARVEENK